MRLDEIKKINEDIESMLDYQEDVVQFQLPSGFYELHKDKKGNWNLMAVFGNENLKIAPKEFKGADADTVKAYLRKRFKNINIYEK